jgi:hypothetical protein
MNYFYENIVQMDHRLRSRIVCFIIQYKTIDLMNCFYEDGVQIDINFEPESCTLS